VLAYTAGWNHGEITEAFATSYEVAAATLLRAPTARSPATRR